MKIDLSKIAVVIIADKNGKIMQRFSPNSYMTQGSVMTIRTEYDDQANGVNARTEPALPIQNVVGSYSEKDMDNAYDKGFADAMKKYRTDL